MIIRSISQLPLNSETSTFLSGSLEMSLPLSSNNSLYVSTKINYSDMLNDIKDATTSAIVNDYALSTAAGKVNVQNLKASIDDVKMYNTEFSGIKSFTSWPCISVDFPAIESADAPGYEQYGNNFEYVLPNVKKVQEMIADNRVFMSTTNSVVSEGNPLPFHALASTNVAVAESLGYNNTIGSGKFYFW